MFCPCPGTQGRADRAEAENSLPLTRSPRQPVSQYEGGTGRVFLKVHRPCIGQSVASLERIRGIDHELLCTDNPGAA